MARKKKAKPAEMESFLGTGPTVQPLADSVPAVPLTLGESPASAFVDEMLGMATATPGLMPGARTLGEPPTGEWAAAEDLPPLPDVGEMVPEPELAAALTGGPNELLAYKHPACASTAFYLRREPAPNENMRNVPLFRFSVLGGHPVDVEHSLHGPMCDHCGMTVGKLHARHVVPEYD